MLALIGILAALLLPALHGAREQTRRVTCFSNLRQLQLAWGMFADDHDGQLPPNRSAGDSWAPGHARADNNTTNLEQGVLFPYTPSASVYRCPADRSRVAGGDRPRTRSYSVNGWLHGDDEWLDSPITNAQQLARFPPADVFVFLDENEDSIDNGAFSILPPGTWIWVDYPGSRHRRAGTLSFADGHAESWRWTGTNAIRFRGHWNPVPSNDRDLRRLQRALPWP